MSLLSQVLASGALTLQADLLSSSGLAHGPTTGEMREEALRSLLAGHFPPKYRFTKGIVVNASGEQSRQQDIIIVDSTSAPPLRASDDSEIYPIEAVAGVIEVKSRLDPGEVASAVDAVATVKRLVSDEQRDEVVHAHQVSGHRFDDLFQTPFGGVFAYSSSANTESIASAFVEANDELPIHERTNALIVLSGCVMMWAMELSGDGPPETRAVWFSCASKDAIPFWVTTEANDLAIFYWILWDAVQNYEQPAFSALKYLQNLEFEGRFWAN